MSDSRFEVHFGGPDRPPRALRDLLAGRLEQVGSGGRVDWVTYYFRDRPLAETLLDAHRRGAQVALVLEGRPRVARANSAVIARLREPGALGASLRVVAMPGIPAPRGLAWKPQVHEKIYCFSQPEPVAFVGSFNPSGDQPEQHPEIVAEIGDHDIAHNALVEIRDPAIVDCLATHVRTLHEGGPRPWQRRSRKLERDFDFGDTTLHFWPRSGPHPVERLLERYGAGSRVRIAASHIRNPGSARCLERLAQRGAQVEVIAEHTERRVPPRMERRLQAAGVAFARRGAAARVPMHLKFVLAEDRAGRHAVFGSFNWTLPSYWLNHEVAVVTRDTAVYEALDRRWRILQEPDPVPAQAAGGAHG